MHIERVMRLTMERDDDDEEDAVPIISVELFNFSQSMIISPETAASIGIFDRESHAAVFSEKTKEGLSLYSILQPTQMPAAKALLARWLSLPSLSLETLNERLDVVEIFSGPRFTANTDALRKCMSRMQNIHRLAARMMADNADFKVWKGIAEFASKAVNIVQVCRSFSEQPAILNRLVHMLDVGTLTFVVESINAIIDWDESMHTQHTRVRWKLDSELDHWRETLKNLPSILANITEEIVRTEETGVNPRYGVSIEYFPQVGYVWAMSRMDGIAMDYDSIAYGEQRGWKYQYSSEIKAYFKNHRTTELDVDLGDLHSLIAGREIEIVQRMQTEVTKYLGLFVSCGDMFAELECLLTFARVSQVNGYVRPEIVEGPSLEIVDGRHPLQERIVDTFVPNDCLLEGGMGVVGMPIDAEQTANSVLIVTGANACGKSIYLRQNALLVVMAQIGCYVPARRARIGIVDRILARIQIDESTSTKQGSFKTDMKQVAEAVNRSTARSLILLDEMGKGTAPSDGAALFAAVLRHFMRRGDDCPRVLCATHFHEAFHEHMLGPQWPFTPAHMRVMLQEDDRESGLSVPIFLYKLQLGLELQSHASQCEKLCGMSDAIIDRAAHVAEASRKHALRQLAASISRQMDRLAKDKDAEMQLDDQDASSGGSTTPKPKPTYMPTTNVKGKVVEEDLLQQEAIARAFIAWDIEADKQQAREVGELASLDPAVKLARLFTQAQRVYQKGSPDDTSFEQFC